MSARSLTRTCPEPSLIDRVLLLEFGGPSAYSTVQMARVTFTIEGPPGAVTLRAFVSAFENQLAILSGVDAALSSKPRGLLDWYVTDLRLGSLEVSIRSGYREDDEPVPTDHDRKVVETYANGFRVIEGEGRSPAYFADRDLIAARQTFRLIGREGVTGFSVNTDLADPVVITPRAAVNVEQLIKPGERTIGAVEGKLVEISIRGKNPRVTVFDAVTKKGVSCYFGEALTDDIKMALGKRVFVHGELTYNRKGEPKSIRLNEFRVLHDKQLPTSRDLLAAIDNLTGDISTKEYLESVRGR